MKVRPFRGKFEVDAHLTGPDGTPIRWRKVAPCTSKSAAKRWGEARLRKFMLDLFGPPPTDPDRKPEPPKDEKPKVPTLAEFAPRFMDGYVIANRQKPSTVAGKRQHFKNHLLPALGKKRLDEIGAEDVQRLKKRFAKNKATTANNILSTLSKLLKVAVEWDVIDRMPCTIKLLKREHVEMRFHDFPEYERLVVGAERVDSNTYVIVLLGGEAGLRCGEMIGLEWTDIDLEGQMLRVARSVWNKHVTPPKSGRPRFVPMTNRLTAALARHRHLRSRRIVCHRTGRFFTQHDVQNHVKRAERMATVDHLGVHALRHTFCSRLAMKGAPTKAIQELAGHSELVTTQRYMHLSPAAKDSAIRLLEPGDEPQAAGDQILGKEAAS